MVTGPEIFTSVINNYLPEPHSSLLNGILFGIDLKASHEFYQQLKVVGLLHLVVLSGMNITLLAGFTTVFTGFFSKRISLLITILIIILFILFVGPKAPIVRAGIMGILTYVAIIKKRKSFVFYSLFLSIIFIAIFFPKWLTSLSLLLSYGATLGIILFGYTSSKNQLWKELKVSFAAQIFTAPLIFIYFRQISLISPVSNLLVAPTITPLMIFGFLTAILGKINYFLGLAPAYICYGILTYLVWIVDKLSQLPFAFFQF